MDGKSMLLIIIEALAIGGASGMIAAVYRCILAYEPIMNWWWKFGNRFENKWFFKPIWGCQKCIGGQVGLWFYLLIVVLPFIATEPAQISNILVSAGKYIAVLIFGLLLSICTAIYSADKICSTIKN